MMEPLPIPLEWDMYVTQAPMGPHPITVALFGQVARAIQ